MIQTQLTFGKRSCALAAGLFAAASAHALTVPFVEDFATGPNDWVLDAGGTPAWSAGGGPAGAGFITTDFNFSTAGGFGSTSIIFRGQENFGDDGASGGAFIGDWLAAGVTAFSYSVRHNAPQPIDFNVRFTTSANTPGIISNNIEVPAGEWTDIVIPIETSSFQSFSGPQSNFGVAFSDLSRMQISINRPDALDGDNTLYSFDLSSPQIIPEPAAALPLGLLAALFAFIGLRRRRLARA